MLRRSPRALVLWTAASAVALLTAVTVAGDLGELRRRADELGPRLRAVVAARDLRLGATARGGDLVTRMVHESQLPPGVLHRVRHARGRVVTVPVLAGGFVAHQNLAPRRPGGLDGALPPGTRAVRVVVAESVRPRRGAGVDVLATFDPGLGPVAADPGGNTVVVASGVLVLGTDRDVSGSAAESAFAVTLLVTEAEATDLAEAAAYGILTLALVPPEESRGPFGG